MRSDMETGSIDRVLYNKNFHKKYAQNVQQKLVQDHNLTLVNIQKYNQ